MQLQTQKVYIQYCINCSMHSWCTFHDESRYHYFLDSTREAILNHNPQAQILQNTLPKQYIKRNSKSFQYGPEERVWDDRVEQYVRFPRVGAFEVYWNGRVIYSKLRTGMWPNPNMVGKYLKELIRDKNKNISTRVPQTQQAQRNDNLFITRAKDPNKIGKKIVTYDQTTDEEPYIDQEEEGDASYDDEDYKGYEMGLEKAHEQNNQQIILDNSAGPGGTRSPKNQGISKKSYKKSILSDKNRQKKLSSSIPTQSSQNPKRRSPSTNRTINTVTPNNVASNLTRSQSKPAKSRLNTQSSTQSKNPHYMKSSVQFEQSKGIPNMKQQFGQTKGGKSMGTLKTQSYEGSRKSFQSSSKRGNLGTTAINKGKIQNNSKPNNQKIKSKQQQYSPASVKKPRNYSQGQVNRNQRLSIDSSSSKKNYQPNIQQKQQMQQRKQTEQTTPKQQHPRTIKEFSSIKKMQLKAKSQQSEQEEEQDEKIIFANDGKQKEAVATPDQVLRGSETPLHQTEDPIQYKQQNQQNQQKFKGTAPQKGTVLNPIQKKPQGQEEDEDEDYGVDQFEQEDQINHQNQTNAKSVSTKQSKKKQEKSQQQDEEDQDYGDDDFQNQDDSKLQNNRTKNKIEEDDFNDNDDDDNDVDQDYSDERKDAQQDNKNNNANYQKFSFNTPYSKDDDGAKKQQQQQNQKIAPPPPLNESAQEQYEDDAFEAQGDNSKVDYQQQMVQSTSNPKIELAGQKGAVNQMLNQQSPPLVIGQGNQAQLASDSEDDNDNDNDDDDDDDDQDEEQINITKVFQMSLAVNKMSSKKINYHNNDDIENQYQLVSSHPDIMSVKEDIVKIPQNSQGKFQLRFGAVSQPCQQQAVLFVLKNKQPWENILFQVSYT